MISEQDRNRLHNKLGEVLGDAEAATLMEHLPPVGWADVATKRDLAHTEVQLRSEIKALGLEIRKEMADLATALTKEMAAQTRAVMLAMVTLQVAVLGYVQLVLK